MCIIVDRVVDDSVILEEFSTIINSHTIDTTITYSTSYVNKDKIIYHLEV